MLDIPLFLLGLNVNGVVIPPNPGTPTPLAIADFKNGIYSIGGVSKTFGDLWQPVPSPAQLTAGVGLEIDGAYTSASCNAVAQTELFNAINPTLGFTAVMDISLVTDPADDPGGASADVEIGKLYTGSNVISGLTLFSAGSGGAFALAGGFLETTPANTPIKGANRYAVTFAPHLRMVSLNGGDSASANDDISAVLATIADFAINLEVSNAPSGATARAAKAVFYPLVTDPTILKALSA